MTDSIVLDEKSGPVFHGVIDRNPGEMEFHPSVRVVFESLATYKCGLRCHRSVYLGIFWVAKAVPALGLV